MALIAIIRPFYQKLKTRDCASITEKQRQWVFDMFWAMNTWEERQTHVRTLAIKVLVSNILFTLSELG